MRRLLNIAIVLAVMISMVGTVHAANMNHQVWFTPAEDSADLIQLFTMPQLWASTRAKVNVFQVGPVLAGAKHRGANGLEQLAAAGAFQSLRKWGIDLALEAPAIKKWDCSGSKALEWTLQLIAKTKRAGGEFKYVALDEPLAAALHDCGYTMDRAADLVASYIKAMRSSDHSLVVGDVMAYPHFAAPEIMAWERMLVARGAKPSFVHLDVDWNSLRVNKRIDSAADFQVLMRFAHTEGFPLGIIFWPGINPISSSESYFQYTLDWVKLVHDAIGAPDQAIFESWVTRSSRTCSDLDRRCKTDNPRCGPADRSDCGQKSIPVNLPDNDPRVYSHTRLISDSLSILGW